MRKSETPDKTKSLGMIKFCTASSLKTFNKLASDGIGSPKLFEQDIVARPFAEAVKTATKSRDLDLRIQKRGSIRQSRTI